MDATEADLLRTIAPETLGQRLRAARVAAGMTQGQLADGQVSVGYVSRIEAGQRRPDARVLEALAERVGTTIGELLRGVSSSESATIHLELQFAELSLESGDAPAALTQIEALLERPSLQGGGLEVNEQVRFLRARALEAVGRLEDAIPVLEASVASGPDGAHWLSASIALSRCYREAGDLNRAVGTGEAVLRQLADLGLDGGDEAVQLICTVAAAYFEQGDVNYAVRLCNQALTRAEQDGSRRARASAYWNVAMMEHERGGTAGAIPLAKKAMALLSEGQDARNLARLRSQLAYMQLQVDPPATDEAMDNLEQAGAQMLSSGSTAVDLARNDATRARGLFLTGQIEESRTLAQQSFEAATSAGAPLLAAEIRVLEGQAAAAQGETRQARELYGEAIHLLTGIGADRSAAQLWLDIGALLEAAEDPDGARDAYRRAAVSSGLQARSSVRATVPSAR